MNWHERINAAEKNGRFSMDDEECASRWVTCACSEQDPRIPRYNYSGAQYSRFEPRDSVLAEHGMLFFQAVAVNDFKESRRILSDIETRSTEILAGLVA